MWNLLIAGIIGGVAYLAFKDDEKEESTSKSSKKKVYRSKQITTKNQESLTLLYAVEKDGFDYAMRSYSDYKKLQDAEFDRLRKDYNTKANALEKYIEENTPFDDKEDIDAQSVLDKEGLEYGFLEEKPYHNWKGVEDGKYQKLLAQGRKSYSQLVAHLKSKYKIKNLDDSELSDAIKKLESK